MKDFSSLLERFSKILNKDAHTKGAIIEVIKKYTQISLGKENIELNEGVLQLNTTPIVKSEINLKSDLIRSELKEVYNLSVTRFLYK
jgi:hypothetical protein